MSLDHGILNVPLDKRGGASQARETRAKAAAYTRLKRAQQAQARFLLERLTLSRAAEIGKSKGMNAIQVISYFRSLAHSEPATVIQALRREAA